MAYPVSSSGGSHDGNNANAFMQVTAFVGPSGLEPGTYGLKVRLPITLDVLAAQTEPQDARNALNAPNALGGVSTEVSMTALAVHHPG
jgi:hypothetical protein